MNGVDFSVWRPGVGWLKANGYGFATRYLCWRPNPKVIDKAEFDSYRAAGIDVVLNWEWDIGDMLGGAANGTAFATEARKQAEALGAWPCPIYFSCDTDAQPWQQPTVNDFLRAACAVLGGSQYVGIYGGYGPVSRAMQAGVAAFGWQTYAWSGGQWYAQAQLRQTGGVADYGFDFSLTDDFGQVGGASPAPKRRVTMVILQAEDGAQWLHNGGVRHIGTAESTALVAAGVPVQKMKGSDIAGIPRASEAPLLMRDPASGAVYAPIPIWRHIGPAEYKALLAENAEVESVDPATAAEISGGR